MGKTENSTNESIRGGESPERCKSEHDDKQEGLKRRRNENSPDSGDLYKVKEPESKRNDFNDDSKHDDSLDRGNREKRDYSADYSSRSPESRRDVSRSRGSDRKRKRVDESRERRADSQDSRSKDRERQRDSSRDRRRRYNSRDRSRDNSRRRSRSRHRRSRSRSRRSRSRGSNSRHTKLFIGNLSFDTDIQTLNRIFSKYGRLTDVYIPRPNNRDESPRYGRPSPKSKGYAFVTYAHPDDAADALRDWDDRELDGRVIAVEYSKPRKPQFRYGSGSRGHRRGGYSRSRSRRRY